MTASWSDGRSEVDRQELVPSVLIARGELNIEDKRLLTSLLGRFGLSTEYMSQTDYDEHERKLAAQALNIVETDTDEKEPFSFTSITSPDDWLVREHLKDFQDRIRATDAAAELGVSQRFVGSVFNYLVDAKGSKRGTTWIWETKSEGRWIPREPQPLDMVVIANRTEAGFPPYDEQATSFRTKNDLCTHYAVQAGSIVTAVNHLTELPSDHPASESLRQRLSLVANQLQQQFVS